ncbi:unnamed protein product [Linum trigynum]|uniref:Gnk2-homologous domain-containing protein n=1 Tax=Linum trigynum TaxID=586398 RepID=A0AAV2F620_9ROSI
MATSILEKLAVATFAVALTMGMISFAAAFNAGAYNCVDVTVLPDSDLYKARHSVLDDMVGSTAPESNGYYCTTSTVGGSVAFGHATCDPSKLSECNDCLKYAREFLDHICKYSIGGQVVVGDLLDCSMHFDARPISECAT